MASQTTLRNCSEEIREEPVYVEASLVAQMVKSLPAIQETLVQSLGWEDPLEKGAATHSSALTWKIPWTEEPGSLQFMGLQRATQLSDFTIFSFLQQRSGSQNIKRLLLIKENQMSQVNEFSVFLHMGRCKCLGSLKSFLQ